MMEDKPMKPYHEYAETPVLKEYMDDCFNRPSVNCLTSLQLSNDTLDDFFFADKTTFDCLYDNWLYKAEFFLQNNVNQSGMYDSDSVCL